MLRTLSLVVFFLCLNTTLVISQSEKQITMDTLPYYQIPDYPENHSSASVLARMIDGLGYRYHWASEGLRDEDLSYKPSELGATTLETLEHIHGLATSINNVAFGKPNIRPYEKLEKDYTLLRSETLQLLKEASDHFRDNDTKDLSEYKLVFKRGEKESSFPIWNLINGQLTDAIYHTGQLVSFRRTSGNPMNSKVNVFMGKNRE